MAHIGTLVENKLGKTGHGMELHIVDKLTDKEFACLTSSVFVDKSTGKIYDYRKSGLGYSYQKRYVGKADGLWHSGYFYRSYDKTVWDRTMTGVLAQEEKPAAKKPTTKKSTENKAPKKSAKTAEQTVSKAEYDALAEKYNALEAKLNKLISALA